MMEIQRPGPQDIEEIDRLFTATIEDTFSREGIDESHADDMATEIRNQQEAIRRDLASGGQDNYFLVARISSRIVGTIAYGPANEDIRKHLEIDLEHTPEIKSVYILPDYQGKGVGSILFDAIIATLRDRKINSFCLDCGYYISQGFWKKKLGEPSVVLKNHFGKGAHLMIWKRDIKPVSLRDPD